MGEPDKKREPLELKLGRPAKGALSTYPNKLKLLISKVRGGHEGWGADSILVELELEEGYKKSDLPSVDAVNRYLKENGFVKERIPSGLMPEDKYKSPVRNFHDLLEMDAQGAVLVKGLGFVAMINVKDSKSKVHCIAFPVHVNNSSSQPKGVHYFWALRLSFEQWGLPKAIQVDRDSVFIDNTSKSPFPSRLRLWLMGLGVKLCFINVPPPLKQAMVERSHQTIHKQVIQGKVYDCWKELFEFTNKRRKRLNANLPNRMLDGQAPLAAFPKAKHSGSYYRVEQEDQQLMMSRIYSYLAKCLWYRKVSGSKTVSLSSKIYYLKNAKVRDLLQIKFCNRSKKLIFRDANGLVVAKLPLQQFSILDIMGDTTKNLISTKKNLFRVRDFPL